MTSQRRRLLAAFLVVSSWSVACCLDRLDLYPFGTLQGDTRLEVGDDLSSAPVRLETPIRFYNDYISTLFVSSPRLIVLFSERSRG